MSGELPLRSVLDQREATDGEREGARGGGVARGVFERLLNPSSYGTPRTTPIGKVPQSLSWEYFSFRRATPNPHPNPEVSYFEPYEDQTSDNLPAVPSFGLRYGLGDRLDIGFRLANASSLGSDLKWNFFRSDVLDLALDPGVQSFLLTGGAESGDAIVPHLFLNSPLSLGINASPEFSIVPSVGLAYGFTIGDPGANGTFERVSTIDASFLQAGIGLDLRLTESFAIHPEISMLRSLSSDNDAKIRWYTFGVGFKWGALPDYGATSRR